jgi:hypothetical protein
MAVGVLQTSRFVEGGDQTRRFQITGDTAYPTGGYVLLSSANPTPAGSPLRGANNQTAVSAFKRIIAVRHRTIASAALGTAVAVDGYSGGYINSLTLAIFTPTGEVANGTNVSALNVELTLEGY